MRFSKLLIVAGVALAAGVSAQDGESAEPEAKAQDERPRLPDVEAALESLIDQPVPEAAAEEQLAQDEPAQEETAQEQAQPAAAAAGPPPPLTAEQRSGLQGSVGRGRQLAAIAVAGQIATRDMLSRIDDPDGAGIAGWLAEPQGNGMSVTFYGEEADRPVAIYRATVLGGRVTAYDVFPAGARPALTPVQARMAAARAAAEAQEHRACSLQGFNYLVVPPEGPRGAVEVYQVSAQSRRGRYPFGGHFRTRIPAAGEAEARGFTNACVEVDVAETPAGERPRPIGLTHLLDPVPTEIHVFLSIWTGRPLLVATGRPESESPDRVWLVTPDRIAEIPPNATAAR